MKKDETETRKTNKRTTKTTKKSVKSKKEKIATKVEKKTLTCCQCGYFKTHPGFCNFNKKYTARKAEACQKFKN